MDKSINSYESIHINKKKYNWNSMGYKECAMLQTYQYFVDNGLNIDQTMFKNIVDIFNNLFKDITLRGIRRSAGWVIAIAKAYNNSGDFTIEKIAEKLKISMDIINSILIYIVE